ncbi:MAG: hypothetical protein ACJ76Z_05385 [Thermoleophilaceae bacterium]
MGEPAPSGGPTRRTVGESRRRFDWILVDVVLLALLLACVAAFVLAHDDFAGGRPLRALSVFLAALIGIPLLVQRLRREWRAPHAMNSGSEDPGFEPVLGTRRGRLILGGFVLLIVGIGLMLAGVSAGAWLVVPGLIGLAAAGSAVGVRPR